MWNDTRGGTLPREGCGLHSSRAAPSFRSAHNLPGILVVAKEEGLLSPNSQTVQMFRKLHGNRHSGASPTRPVEDARRGELPRYRTRDAFLAGAFAV